MSSEAERDALKAQLAFYASYFHRHQQGILYGSPSGGDGLGGLGSPGYSDSAADPAHMPHEQLIACARVNAAEAHALRLRVAVLERERDHLTGLVKRAEQAADVRAERMRREMDLLSEEAEGHLDALEQCRAHIAALEKERLLFKKGGGGAEAAVGAHVSWSLQAALLALLELCMRAIIEADAIRTLHLRAAEFPDPSRSAAPCGEDAAAEAARRGVAGAAPLALQQRVAAATAAMPFVLATADPSVSNSISSSSPATIREHVLATITAAWRQVEGLALAPPLAPTASPNPSHSRNGRPPSPFAGAAAPTSRRRDAHAAPPQRPPFAQGLSSWAVFSPPRHGSVPILGAGATATGSPSSGPQPSTQSPPPAAWSEAVAAANADLDRRLFEDGSGLVELATRQMSHSIERCRLVAPAVSAAALSGVSSPSSPARRRLLQMIVHPEADLSQSPADGLSSSPAAASPRPHNTQHGAVFDESSEAVFDKIVAAKRELLTLESVARSTPDPAMRQRMLRQIKAIHASLLQEGGGGDGDVIAGDPSPSPSPRRRRSAGNGSTVGSPNGLLRAAKLELSQSPHR